MLYDNFINIPYQVNNLDLYIVRTSILKAINENLPNFGGTFLDIGCGKMPYKEFILKNSKVKEYVGLDIESAIEYDKNVRPDFTWDGKIMPFENNSFDCAFGTEVLEHCPEPETILKEVYRILKPEGIFFFTTPFLWNLHEVPHDEYRFTPFSLERHFKNSGFGKIEIKSAGGWNAALAQMLGLWVRRAPMSNRKRDLLSTLVKPIIGYLLKRDIVPKNFNGAYMLTTLYGSCHK